MICNINIIEFLISLVLFSGLNISICFVSNGIFLSLCWEQTVFLHLLDLQDFETNSGIPLSIELVHLLSLIESWHHKFLTPPWCKWILESRSLTRNPCILNDLLIIKCSWESPDFLFILTVINMWNIWVWWIGEATLTLNIIEFKSFIVILSCDSWRHSNDILFIWLILLNSFKFISNNHWNIINIT